MPGRKKERNQMQNSPLFSNYTLNILKAIYFYIILIYLSVFSFKDEKLYITINDKYNELKKHQHKYVN